MNDLFGRALLASKPYGYSDAQYKGYVIEFIKKFDSEVELRVHRDLRFDDFVKSRLFNRVMCTVQPMKLEPGATPDYGYTDVDVEEECRKELSLEYSELTKELVHLWRKLQSPSKKEKTLIEYYRAEFGDMETVLTTREIKGFNDEGV